jgi:hypothetical protein
MPPNPKVKVLHHPILPNEINHGLQDCLNRPLLPKVAFKWTPSMAMKNIIIEVPRNGASVQLVLRGGASSGQAVIVASDEVEVRLAKPVSVPAAQPKPAASGKPPAPDLDTILKRLAKLKTTTRKAAVNSIKAMFQFADPISDDDANKILEDLRKRGSLSIDANDKLQFRNA